MFDLFIYFHHLFLQGYDDITKELPDSDAKNVVTEVFAIPINVLWILDFRGNKFLIQVVWCYSQRTGKTRKMVSGLPQPFPILSTKAHGRRRFVSLFEIESIWCQFVIRGPCINASAALVPENQEPQLPGQVEGTKDWQPRFVLTPVGCHVNAPQVPPILYWLNVSVSQISRMIQNFMFTPVWDMLALNCGR